MVLKLYGHPQSTCTKRVAVVLYEKKVPFEFTAVNLPEGEHKSPEYLKKQPFGQIPYIDDDGFILFESRAISRYIATKYASQGTPLIPAASDLKSTALFEQAASIEQSNFDAFAAKAVAESVFKQFYGQPVDQARVDELISSLDSKLEGYDAILGKQKYLAGNEITLADLFHLPYGTLIGPGGTGSDVLSRKKNVDKWWKDVSSRPSWQAVAGEVKGFDKY